MCSVCDALEPGALVLCISVLCTHVAWTAFRLEGPPPPFILFEDGKFTVSLTPFQHFAVLSQHELERCLKRNAPDIVMVHVQHSPH